MLNFQLAANITQIDIGTVLSNFAQYSKDTYSTHRIAICLFFHKSGFSVLPFNSQAMC